MTPGSSEILILLAIFVFIFGIDKIPKLARSLGMAKGEFQQGIADSRRMTENDLDRAGKTENVALAEKAAESGVEIEGKSADEVKEELE